MSVNGPLKEVFEEAMREVREDWPAWMRSREIAGSTSGALMSKASECAAVNHAQDQSVTKKD